MKRDPFGTLVITGVILGMVIFAVLFISLAQPSQAQDTAPKWDYAILVYGNNDASVFTGDGAIDSALTELLVPQDSDAGNIALALNVMGDDGWELVEIIPGASSIYIFKKQM